MNHDSEPRHLNHDKPRHFEPRRTTTKSRLLPGVVSVARGSQWWECTVLENLPGYGPQKWPEIAVLGLIFSITGNLPGCRLRKSVEITVLRLIRVSQETFQKICIFIK